MGAQEDAVGCAEWFIDGRAWPSRPRESDSRIKQVVYTEFQMMDCKDVQGMEKLQITDGDSRVQVLVTLLNGGTQTVDVQRFETVDDLMSRVSIRG